MNEYCIVDAMNNADEDEAGGGRRSRYAAGAVAATTLACTTIAIAPFLRGVTKKAPMLPYMATPHSKVRRALQNIVSANKKRSGSKRDVVGGVFVDLGSGDGECVYQAVKFGFRHAIGIERNFTLYCFSQLRRWFFWSRDQRRRSQFLCQDFFQYDLSRSNEASTGATADLIDNTTTTVMIFGVRPLMARISQKLAQECSDGTYVLSYRFPLPVAGVERSSTGKTRSTDSNDENRDYDDFLQADEVFDEAEMRVYEVKKKNGKEAVLKV